MHEQVLALVRMELNGKGNALVSLLKEQWREKKKGKH